MSTIKPMHTNLVYGIAILLLILGFFGYLEIKNYTYLGYNSNDFEVTKVDEGSPAAQAGMMIGDKIKTMAGIDARDAKTWDKKPRAKVGESREFVVDRGGEEVSYTLTYASLPSKQKLLNRLGWTMGLIFMIMGVWTFSKRKNYAALLFAFFALAFGSTFVGRPYIADPALRDVVSSVYTSFLLLGFAFLVAFLHHFPTKSAFMEKNNAMKILFLPAIIMSAIIVCLNIFEPDSTSTLNTVMDMLFLFFIVFYFGWSVIMLVRKYMAAGSEERSSTGLSLLFWGAILGILPMLIYFIIGYISPTATLPGEDFIFLTMVFIPVLFAMAINKSGDAATA